MGSGLVKENLVGLNARNLPNVQAQLIRMGLAAAQPVAQEKHLMRRHVQFGSEMA